ncbi:hypothetical protein VOI32_16525 [Paraburkholderia caribensis]|uniref:Uncharacterized protein n=1 Tax=Paraburkholderia caribensis TaxID=75105 RepID=A0ABV0DWN7_9BURK
MGACRHEEWGLRFRFIGLGLLVLVYWFWFIGFGLLVLVFWFWVFWFCQRALCLGLHGALLASAFAPFRGAGGVVWFGLVWFAWVFAGIRDALAHFTRRPCAGRHLLFFAAAKKSRQKKAAHTASP